MAMTLPEGVLYLLFAAISLLSAAAAVVLTGYIQTAIRRRSRAEMPEIGQEGQTAGAAPPVSAPIRYTFADGRLLSEVREDDPFLAPDIDRHYAPTALSEAMATLHPDLPDRIADLMARGEPFRVVGYLGSDALSVAGQAERDHLAVTIAPATEGEGRSLDLAERQVDRLRRALGLYADAQWTEAADGRVTWCNDAYLKLASETGGLGTDQLRWPPGRLFGEQLDPPPTDGNQRRCHLRRRNPDVTHWFEVTSLRLEGGDILFSARPIDRLVTAETSLRDFVQTLSKTFATLPVGLVVFDRKRELVLFNPALVSVSTLDPGFLSRRPTLRAFLDQLREVQRMPEPRDYRSWREEIALLEQGAEADRYHEIWTLPSGETLRVTGRPHPNGAIAFVFEDISQEVSLTRRFRTDLDLDLCILDDMPAGLIVFDRDGEVLRTNAAYRTMLRDRFDGAVDTVAALDTTEATLTEMTLVWQEVFLPSGLWGEIRQFVRHETDRAAWSDAVTERSGARMHCRVAPLRGGNTVVWFLPADTGWGELLADGEWLGESETGILRTRAAPASERGEGVA
jgi:PAS domain-containing protein